MTDLHVKVLGPLTVIRGDAEAPRLSKAVRHLIAVLAAAGPAGITRDQLALDLWDLPLPDSWQSAIRNRTTAARRTLGADAIVTESNRLCFGSHVTVDSWQLGKIAQDPASFDGDPLMFLDGEPYEGKVSSPQIEQSRAKVGDLRAVLIQTLSRSSAAPLSLPALTALRGYQRRHPLDAAVTETVVRAHLDSGDASQAHDIVRTLKLLVANEAEPPIWIDSLEDLVDTATSGGQHDGHERSAATSDSASTQTEALRSDLFASAVLDEDWGLALEIATNGLPAAARMEGDPARLALLEAIPLDKLPEGRRFELAAALARHLMYAKRDAEALEFAETARTVAATPNEHLLAYILEAGVVGSSDERSPIPLPRAFRDSTDESVIMQSLQVAVMSHLERASFEQAAPLCQRFNELVDASADPYRRWHMLLLESMLLFVDGELEAARDAAERAYKYGHLSSIVDAEVALIGQLSNAHWLHSDIAGPGDLAGDFPDTSSHLLSRALQVALADADQRPGLLDGFMRTFDFMNRSFFTFPTLVIVARHVRSPDTRQAVRARLQRRSDTTAIWGTGVLHLGPVDRCIAQVSDDRHDQENHLEAAVRVADRQRTRLWQVVCRLDLAFATGNPNHRSKAASLATTAELQSLVENYPGHREAI